MQFKYEIEECKAKIDFWLPNNLSSRQSTTNAKGQSSNLNVSIVCAYKAQKCANEAHKRSPSSL